MNDIFIKSISCYIPEGRITNDEIMERFKDDNKGIFSDDELADIVYGCKRKLEFLGAKTRSVCNGQDNSITMAIKVAEEAIKKANLNKNKLDAIIFTAVANPFREPSYANMLAAQLGISQGDFFDINDTCNGFLKGMEIAKLYINSGKYNNVLVITSEDPYEISKNMGNVLKIQNETEVDQVISYLFVGSGAAAMVLSNEGSTKRFINYAQLKTTGNWDATLYVNPFIKLPKNRFGNKNTGVWADGRCISSAIIREMPDFIKKQMQEWKLGVEDINYVFIHQLGDNITFATANSIGIERDKLPVNTFSDYGNLASANLPVTLAIADERGMLKKGDSIMLFSSSCGISYSMAHLIV